jgi:hypothetical protein
LYVGGNNVSDRKTRENSAATKTYQPDHFKDTGAVIEANTKGSYFLSSVGSERLPLFNRPYILGVRNEGLLLFVLNPVDTARKDRTGLHWAAHWAALDAALDAAFIST